MNHKRISKLILIVLAIVMCMTVVSACSFKKVGTDSSASPSVKETKEEVASTPKLDNDTSKTEVLDDKVEKGFKLYQNSQYKFSFSYRDTWSMQENYMSTVVSVKQPLEGAGDRFQENLNVVVKSTPTLTTADLDDVSTAALSQLKTTYPDMKLVSSSNAKLSNNDAKKIVYTTTQSGIKLKILQEYTIKDGEMYVVTFGSDEKNFASSEKYADEVLANFKIN